MSNRRAALLAMVCAGVSACRQDMHDQPSYRPLQESTFFADNRSARPLVDGTVARGHLKDDVEYHTGVRAGAARQTANPVPVNAQVAAGTGGDPYAQFVTEFPMPVTPELLQRGRDRFNMFCTPCHDYTGSGRGMIVQRGLTPPPSYHIERLRKAPVGHFFDVVTNGYGAMYSYSSRVPVADRWAIIAYIRALQASQSAALSDVPPEQRGQMAPQPSTPPAGDTASPGSMRPGSTPPTDRPADAVPKGVR